MSQIRIRPQPVPQIAYSASKWDMPILRRPAIHSRRSSVRLSKHVQVARCCRIFFSIADLRSERFLIFNPNFIDRYRFPKHFEMMAMLRDDINEVSSRYFDKLMPENRRKVFASTISAITVSINWN